MTGRPVPRFFLWRSSVLLRFAAALAFVTQVGMLAADIVEGANGIGTAAHVDAQGTARHYAHNDATCAACAVRSLHASAPSHPPVRRESSRETLGIDARVVRPVAQDRHSLQLSRAPPSMI